MFWVTDYRSFAGCYRDSSGQVSSICDEACSTIGTTENQLSDTCEFAFVPR